MAVPTGITSTGEDRHTCAETAAMIHKLVERIATRSYPYDVQLLDSVLGTIMKKLCEDEYIVHQCDEMDECVGLEMPEPEDMPISGK